MNRCESCKDMKEAVLDYKKSVNEYKKSAEDYIDELEAKLKIATDALERIHNPDHFNKVWMKIIDEALKQILPRTEEKSE